MLVRHPRPALDQVVVFDVRAGAGDDTLAALDPATGGEQPVRGAPSGSSRRAWRRRRSCGTATSSGPCTRSRQRGRWPCGRGLPTTRSATGRVRALRAHPFRQPRFEGRSARRNPRVSRAMRRSAITQVSAVGDEYARGDGPFPERIHVNALLVTLMVEQARMASRWAAWAKAEVERWPDAATPDVEWAVQALCAA